MTHKPAYGANRAVELERTIKAMTREQQRLINVNECLTAALRFMVLAPDSGIWGELAARALRGERPPPR